MAQAFDYFVVFAEMRTGSNFLESNLNALDGVSCHGEAFNPAFIGHPERDEVLFVSLVQRQTEPGLLLDTIRNAKDGIHGFRYFQDHDPRILDHMLDDPACAKIILTRNPLDSYVSLKIARQTDQWKLTHVKGRKATRVDFDEAEFERHLHDAQRFQVMLMNRLQSNGQTAFYLDYEDLQNLAVINGLAKWLGAPGRLEKLDQSLKRQNPAPLRDKLTNPDAIDTAMASLDRFNIGRTPNFEPRRGPLVPHYIAAKSAPLLFLPIAGGPTQAVCNWIAKLDSCDADALQTSMNRKQLRNWKEAHPEHRSFTVLRHPVARAHHVFCTHILNDGPDGLPRIRQALRQQFKLPVPKTGLPNNYSVEDHRLAFEVFIDFLHANLNGQTGVRVDARWASQSQIIHGFGEVQLPDMILREDDLPSTLPVGSAGVANWTAADPDTPFALSDIYDAQLEAKLRRVYQRDYAMFGFTDWTAP